MSERGEFATSRNNLRARKALAVLTTAAVYMGSRYVDNTSAHSKQAEARISQLERSNKLQAKELKRVAAITGSLAGADKETILGTSLRSVESLPGYGQKVTHEQYERLRAATVKIVSRYKGAAIPSVWSENCTGTKVRIEGQDYVATAAHCFGEESSRYMGKGGGGPQAETIAKNFSDVTNKEYAMVDPSHDPVNRDEHPIALFSGLSISLVGPDWALLKPTFIDEQFQSAFEAIPALTYTSESHRKPGEQVALYGVPAANDNYPVPGFGVYLGRVPSDTDTSIFVDLVGIRAHSPSQDACNFGASGSHALFADGYVTGPLALRNNVSNTKVANPGDDPQIGIDNRLQFERELGIDMSSFETVCGFAAPLPDTLSSLVAGFDQVVTPDHYDYSMK